MLIPDLDHKNFLFSIFGRFFTKLEAERNFTLPPRGGGKSNIDMVLMAIKQDFALLKEAVRNRCVVVQNAQDLLLNLHPLIQSCY